MYLAEYGNTYITRLYDVLMERRFRFLKRTLASVVFSVASVLGLSGCDDDEAWKTDAYVPPVALIADNTSGGPTSASGSPDPKDLDWCALKSDGSAAFLAWQNIVYAVDQNGDTIDVCYPIGARNETNVDSAIGMLQSDQVKPQWCSYSDPSNEIVRNVFSTNELTGSMIKYDENTLPYNLIVQGKGEVLQDIDDASSLPNTMNTGPGEFSIAVTCPRADGKYAGVTTACAFLRDHGDSVEDAMRKSHQQQFSYMIVPSLEATSNSGPLADLVGSGLNGIVEYNLNDVDPNTGFMSFTFEPTSDPESLNSRRIGESEIDPSRLHANTTLENLAMYDELAPEAYHRNFAPGELVSSASASAEWDPSLADRSLLVYNLADASYLPGGGDPNNPKTTGNIFEAGALKFYLETNVPERFGAVPASLDLDNVQTQVVINSTDPNGVMQPNLVTIRAIGYDEETNRMAWESQYVVPSMTEDSAGIYAAPFPDNSDPNNPTSRIEEIVAIEVGAGDCLGYPMDYNTTNELGRYAEFVDLAQKGIYDPAHDLNYDWTVDEGDLVYYASRFLEPSH